MNNSCSKKKAKSGSKFFTLHSSLFTCRRHYPSSSPPVVPPPWLPPWPAPPSVMSSSPDAAAAACGSTFCQLTSSENWRLRSAMPLCLQRTSRLRCNPVGSCRWQRSASRRLPRLESPAHRGTAIARLCRLLPKGRKNAGGYIALWLLALRWCSGERSSESAAIPFGGIAQTSNVSVPFGMGTA